MTGQVLDSYSETNWDNGYAISSLVSYNELFQSFTMTTDGLLSSIILYLQRGGTAARELIVYVKAHTGTYGVDGTPAGAALATSAAVDVSTLTTGYTLITFTFSGANRIRLTAGTQYCVVLAAYSGTWGAPNIVRWGCDSSSPTHMGNYGNKIDGVYYPIEADGCFYVYGEKLSKTFSNIIQSLERNTPMSFSEIIRRLEKS